MSQSWRLRTRTRQGMAVCSGGRPARADFGQFLRRDAGVLGRGIAVPAAPYHGPQDANGAEDEKRCAPAERGLERHHEQRRGCPAEAARAQHPSLRPRALARGEPARDAARGVGVGARLAGPEQEAYRQQGDKTGNSAGQAREGGPPEHDAGHYGALAATVAHGAGGDLEDAVSEHEGAQDPAPAVGRDAQLVLHARPGDGDADAVQEQDHRKRREQREDDMAFLHRGNEFMIARKSA